MGLASGEWSRREGDDRLDVRGARALASRIKADHPTWRVEVQKIAQGLAAVEVTRPSGPKKRLLREREYQRIQRGEILPRGQT